MEEPGEEIEAVLAEGKAPEIIVSTGPAELLVTQGKPQMKPIGGTNLLYVDNTAGDMFLDLDDQSYYVGLTGRWYRSKSLEKGPWSFVEGDDLPKDFSKIATSNPKANVLATVPGTPAAQEAVIAEQHSPDGRGQPRGGEVRGPVRRRAPVRRRPGYVSPVRRQLADAGRARLADLATTRSREASGSRPGRRSDRGRWPRPCRP